MIEMISLIGVMIGLYIATKTFDILVGKTESGNPRQLTQIIAAFALFAALAGTAVFVLYILNVTDPGIDTSILNR